MKRLLLVFIPILLPVAAVRSEPTTGNLIFVEGGAFKLAKAAGNDQRVTLRGFYIGKFEVTQKEWRDVMGNNPSQFRGDALPVENVSWYDCIAYCIARSRKEGLTPCYTIDRERKDPDNTSDVDDVKWTVTLDPTADGYRLPTEAEWEYAASGGKLGRGCIFSGSQEIDEVAWYWQNAGDERLTGLWSWPKIEGNHNRTHPVGGKKPNELGLHDLSGNVREWCWDWFVDAPVAGAGPRGGAGRVWRGGGWLGGDFCCEVSFRGSFEASGRGPDQGLRVCRGKSEARLSSRSR